MESGQSNNQKIEKNKFDFKDSKYATGRRKRSIAKVWLKKVLAIFRLMENNMTLISKEAHIKFKY